MTAPTTSARRYPLEPLAKKLGIELGQPSGDWDDDEVLRGIPGLAELLHRDPGTVKGYRRHGIPSDLADEFACHVAGVNPMDIWPEWEDD